MDLAAVLTAPSALSICRVPTDTYPFGSTAFDEDTIAEDEEEKDPDNEIYGLSFLHSSLFTTIFEDCITQMRILVGCNTALNLMKTYVDLGLLRAKKFSVEQPAYKDELEGVTMKNLGCNDYKVYKLHADREYMEHVLVTSYLSMIFRRNYKTFDAFTKSLEERFDYYPNLVEDEAKSRANRKELSKQLRQFRNHVKSVYYDTDCIIADLKTNVEDALLKAETCSRYVEGWQRARTEQNNEMIREKEAKPLSQIEYYKQRTDHEHRVHTEVDLLVTIAINETLAKVETWMNKYDTDIEAMDLKIQIMKNKYTNIVERREDLEKTLEKHGELIKNWVHFKEEREKARLYREKMTNAAITVQAWWRGLLVRNQLGPYKPQPKRKGAAAEKDKKGKKK